MKRTALAALALLAMAVRTAAADAPPREFEFRIAPGQAHEICIPVAPDGGIGFSWQSEAPLDFNVHRREGDRVVTPIDVRGASRQSGEVTATGAREQCLTWTAPRSQSVGVSGRWRPL